MPFSRRLAERSAAARWVQRLVVVCLVIVLSRMPVPVLHAHAAWRNAPSESRLETHLKHRHKDDHLCRCHWLDWHLHWVSPLETAATGLDADPCRLPGCPTETQIVAAGMTALQSQITGETLPADWTQCLSTLAGCDPCQSLVMAPLTSVRVADIPARPLTDVLRC